VSNGPIPGEDEDMHCLVSGDYEDDVKKAVMRKDLSFFSSFFLLGKPYEHILIIIFPYRN